MYGSTATFVYSEIWNFSTVLTKKQFTAVNLLSVQTVLGMNFHCNSFLTGFVRCGT